MFTGYSSFFIYNETLKCRVQFHGVREGVDLLPPCSKRSRFHFADHAIATRLVYPILNLYKPRACLTSLLGFKPTKIRSFTIKTRVKQGRYTFGRCFRPFDSSRGCPNEPDQPISCKRQLEVMVGPMNMVYPLMKCQATSGGGCFFFLFFFNIFFSMALVFL